MFSLHVFKFFQMLNEVYGLSIMVWGILWHPLVFQVSVWQKGNILFCGFNAYDGTLKKTPRIF